MITQSPWLPCGHRECGHSSGRCYAISPVWTMLGAMHIAMQEIVSGADQNEKADQRRGWQLFFLVLPYAGCSDSFVAAICQNSRWRCSGCFPSEGVGAVVDQQRGMCSVVHGFAPTTLESDEHQRTGRTNPVGEVPSGCQGVGGRSCKQKIRDLLSDPERRPTVPYQPLTAELRDYRACSL